MINKNDICQAVASIAKGVPTTPPTTYPTIFQLAQDCLMKPSLDHQYQVKDLLLDNIVAVFLQKIENYLSRENMNNLAKLKRLYQEMVPNVIRFRSLDFDKLQEQHIGYANQEAIQMSHVDMVTDAMINYSLDPSMTIRYIKGDYVGKNQNVKHILKDISSHIDEVNAGHVNPFLTQGCPSKINFEETSKMKAVITEKGNHARPSRYTLILSSR
jgi:uncharacterized protein YqfB (UPF0267 family)